MPPDTPPQRPPELSSRLISALSRVLWEKAYWPESEEIPA